MFSEEEEEEEESRMEKGKFDCARLLLFCSLLSSRPLQCGFCYTTPCSSIGRS